jgi:hypothetical protein
MPWLWFDDTVIQCWKEEVARLAVGRPPLGLRRVLPFILRRLPAVRQDAESSGATFGWTAQDPGLDVQAETAEGACSLRDEAGGAKARGASRR